CAVIKVDGGGSQKPLYEFNALTCPSAQFKLGSPESAIQRSDYNAIVLRDQQKGDYLDITFEAERDVEGYMVAEVVGSPRCGLLRMELDGVVLAQEINGYAPRHGRAVIAVNLGRQKLRAGSHVLRLVSLGPSPESDGHRISFRGFKMFGQFGSTDYVLGLSSKLAVEKGGMGTVIGSTESGDTLSAVWTGPLAKGQQARFFALVAPKAGSVDAAAGNCLPLAPNAVALALADGHALAAAGEYEDIRADFAVKGTDHLVAYSATRCGEFIASDNPVDMDWTFSAGALALNCPRKSTVTLALAGTQVRVNGHEVTGSTLALEAGKHVVTGAAPRASLLAQNRTRLASVFGEATAARVRAPVVEDKAPPITAPALKPVWQAQTGDFPFALHAFQTGGKPFVAVSADKQVLVLDGAGALVRKLQADDVVRAIHYWPEAAALAVGCRDFRVIAFDPATGDRRWVFESTDINPEFKKAGVSGWYDRSPTDNKGIHSLTSGLFLDGRSQLMVGTASTVEAVSDQGKLRASMNGGVGVVTDIALLDCGSEVRLFPARLFGNSQLQHTSSQTPDKSTRMFVGPFTPRQGASTHVANIGNGYLAVETADLDGDGRQELVGLFNGTLNGLHVWDTQGNVLADAAFGPGAASPRTTWAKRVQTPNMRGLAIADLDGDGKKELAVITARRFAIVLNHRCEKLWARPLPSDPTAVVALAAEAGHPGRLVVSCRDGAVYVLDAHGKFLAQGKVDGIPARMQPLSSTEVVIATAEGAAIAYRVR
ncbi:MAG: VCBS repeat-containing protein, partial [Planctomycetes bacterium]|nr:VCBS repeat-containing protein [Planctomycetota bacterium]